MIRSLFLGLLTLATIDLYAQRPEPLSPSLLQKRRSLVTDTLLLSVSFDALPQSEAFPSSAVLLKTLREWNTVLLRLPAKDLGALLGMKGVQFINESLQPKEELTTGAVDHSLNGIDLVHHAWPASRGAGINASVKERLFDTTDIDLKGRYFLTGQENSLVTAHASLMATIMGGGGNSSSNGLGVAPSSRLTSTSFTNLFPEPGSFYTTHVISVQNHSYGTAVESFYGNEARSYDLLANTQPTLLHVFSAGNNGSSTPASGTYAGVPQMANLTGNFKSAKNVLTVGATDSFNVAMAQNSRGPVHDGRIKPELVAYGEDGSSGAAALVSGTALLLQEAYKKIYGQLPLSSLLRAVVINSAKDIGQSNPDHLTGFGSLDAFKALETVEQWRTKTDSVGQNNTKTFNITVPAGIKRLRVSMAWNDPAAAVNASKTLVHDLDLLLSQGTQSWQPWILNTKPVRDSLLLPATRGRDTLNNMEQVTIDNPSAGIYTVSVHGSNIATGQQAYSLAWQLDTANVLRFSYPVTTLPAGNRQLVRWETTLTGAANLSYSFDRANWQALATVSDISTGWQPWQVPDTVSRVWLRLSHPSLNNPVVTDTILITQPLVLQTGFNCADSFQLYWNRGTATQYQLYALGNAYLQPLLAVSDTTIVLSKLQYPFAYYAVAPVLGSKAGLRSGTILSAAGGDACYLKSFYLQLQTANSASFTAETGSLHGVTSVHFEKLGANGFSPLRSVAPVTTQSFLFTDSALLNGENRYRFRVQLANGQSVMSAVETIYHVSDTNTVFLYPNPVPAGGTIRYVAPRAGAYSLSIYNLQGALVYEARLNRSAGSLRLPLGAGIYILRVVGEDGRVSVRKMLVF